MKKSYLYLALAIAICGCKATTIPSTDSTTKQTVAKEQSSTSYTSPTAVSPATVAAGPKISDIPASLKTEAFDYYGLANSSSIPLQMTGGKQPEKLGSRERKLIRVASDSATFEEDWTAGLMELGPSTVEALPDGIYTTSAFGHLLPKPALELPANVKPGTKWHVDNKVVDQGKPFEEIGDISVIGVQKVTIGTKSYDALLVKETGQLKTDGNSIDVASQKWYVKGLGEVKESLQTTSGGTQNIVVEVTG